MVSYYGSVFDKDPAGSTTVDDFLRDIKCGRWKKETLEARSILKNDEDAYKEYKKKLPAATIAGSFLPNGRKAANIEKESGFLCIDMDHLRDLGETSSILCLDPAVYGCFVSLSGKGLAVVVKKQTRMSHKEAFDSAKYHFESKYSIVVDQGASDISRTRTISHDEKCFINPKALRIKKAQPLAAPPKAKVFNNIVVTNKTVEKIVSKIEEVKVVIATGYYEWRQIAFSLASLGEEGRVYFHRIKMLDVKYDPDFTDAKFTEILTNKRGIINIGTFLYYAKCSGVDIKQALPVWHDKVVYLAVEEKNRNGTVQSALQLIKGNLKIDGSWDDVEAVIEQVFKQHIKIIDHDNLTIMESIALIMEVEYPGLRRNLVTSMLEVHDPKRGIVVLDDVDLNTLFLEIVKKDERINTKKGLVMDYLNSRNINGINPFLEFFRKNKDTVIDSTYPNIRAICRCIETDTGLNDDSVDNEYTEYFFRKWGVGMISSIYGQHSPLVLVLSGIKKNTGKTEFFRRLLPTEIQLYFSEFQHESQHSDLLAKFAKNILMLDDEFEGKTRKQVGLLKQLTSTQFIDARQPYGRVSKKTPRLATMAGTCNEIDVIADPDVNRRIIPINVLSIDLDMYNSVNKTMLFLELHSLYNSGFKHNLSHDDIVRLGVSTEAFKTVQVEEELLTKYFEPSEEESSESFWTSIDIRLHIEKQSQTKFNTWQLFRCMGKLFRKGSKRINGVLKKGYYVDKVLPIVTPEWSSGCV